MSSRRVAQGLASTIAAVGFAFSAGLSAGMEEGDRCGARVTYPWYVVAAVSLLSRRIDLCLVFVSSIRCSPHSFPFGPCFRRLGMALVLC